MSGTGGGVVTPPAPLVYGQAALAPPGFPAAALPERQWTDTPLFVDLPAEGVYWIDGAVVLSFQGASSGALCYRLYDETAGVPVVDSERRVGAGTASEPITFVTTCPVAVWHTAGAATTVRLQAMRTTTGTLGGLLSTVSDGVRLSFTTLSFERRG